VLCLFLNCINHIDIRCFADEKFPDFAANAWPWTMLLQKETILFDAVFAKETNAHSSIINILDDFMANFVSLNEPFRTGNV
jgi:hypothetical protein